MKTIKCPKCGRRAFDISKRLKEKVTIAVKCPQCGKFVTITCNEKPEIQTEE